MERSCFTEEGIGFFCALKMDCRTIIRRDEVWKTDEDDDIAVR